MTPVVDKLERWVEQMLARLETDNGISRGASWIPSSSKSSSPLDHDVDLEAVELLLSNVEQMRKANQKDVDVWMLEPRHMAVGSLTGTEFTQCAGGPCVQGRPQKAKARDKPYSFLSFDFQRNLLVAKARLDLDGRELAPVLKPLDIEIPLGDITARGLHITTRAMRNNLTQVDLTVAVRRPPRYFVRFDETVRKSTKGKLTRRRATELDFAITDTCEAEAWPIRPINEGSTRFPTHWNAFRWVLQLEPTELKRLVKCQVLIQRIPDLHVLSKLPYAVTVRETFSTMWDAPDLTGLDFEVRTLVEGLVANGILRPIDWPILLAALDSSGYSHEVKLRVMESLFIEDRLVDIPATFKKRARQFRGAPQTKEIEHVVMIRTVQVTPTRLLIGPPKQEASNSVTRRYSDSLEHIIRVQFVDEGDRLHILDYAKKADDLFPEVGLMARVRRALNQGIKIGGQHFLPIASSGSQQKDHAIWFFNPAGIDPTELYQWIGTVNETVVAKYSARMGLPFSTSRQVDIVVDLGKREDMEKNGHCFTDGCSVAGTEVMWKAAQALSPNKTIATPPSAIQFRLGGAKGMLSCWPDLVGPSEVLLRKSQVKFDSDQQVLNVIRVAHYQPAFLNRQFIMIMEANGVPQELFLDLFAQALARGQGLEERISKRSLTGQDELLLSTCIALPLSTLIKSGFHDNPFILDACRLIKGRALQDLKWRNRLQIEGGVFLMGISDEESCLREGEVFCQYQKDDNSEPIIVTGEVLVCRAPALHPGDVRRAQAVDHPRLRHLKNVVVFSTQGDRPLPNMLGGGDLDGDDYTLIWDQRFVQPLREFPPMNYTAPPPIRVKEVTREHLNENFVNYIMNDILGQVDNAHLANSDIHTPFATACLELSEIHSTAVDFAKTGQPAVLNPKLVPEKWPDFMGKPDDKTYESGKILGRLFRMVIPERGFAPTDLVGAGYVFHPHLKDRFGEGNFPLFLALQDVKSRYEYDIQYTMRQFNVQEVEMVTGVPAHSANRLRSREQQHLRESLDVVYQTHVQAARSDAMEAARTVAGMPTNIPWERYIAWHAYKLVFEESMVIKNDQMLNDRLRGPSDDGIDEGLRVLPLMSFAFVWWPELLELLV